LSAAIPIPKDEYYTDYISDPETLELYYEEYMNNPKIRREFENNIRSFLKQDYPDKVIEGKEMIDGELINCWYEYEDFENYEDYKEKEANRELNIYAKEELS
jgi:hypothetical protein